MHGLILAAVAGMAVSLVATRIMLTYARRHGLVDLPGYRRSHTQPTPRGGGLGIVAATLLVGVPAWFAQSPHAAWAMRVGFVLAFLAVALVGWRDDHAPLPVLPRLGVHVGAALLVSGLLLTPAVLQNAAWWWLLPPLTLVLAGSINAHNFMDGIDGMLGQQGLFSLAGLGMLAVGLGNNGVALLAFSMAGACAGFLVFNRPPARIFMGDVGSGALGLAIATIAGLVVQHAPPLFWAACILPSAFVIDSTLTLLRRVLAGQRWYAPHRQHLYQWLVRIHWSHTHTDLVYAAWNLAVVAPLAWFAFAHPAAGPCCAIAAYAAATGAWFVGKRACLGAVLRRRSRESA